MGFATLCLFLISCELSEEILCFPVKKTTTHVDVLVLVFRNLTYHGSGMCHCAFAYLVVYEGNSLIDSFLCSGMYSEIMLKKLTRLLIRVLRWGLLILGENVSP